MLIACSSCHRQYEVGDLPAGAKVRCFCGALTAVPSRSVRQAPMQHCSNCGGALAGGETRCGYCDARIELGERGWGGTCPECQARLVGGARYCSVCGVAIRPQAALRPLADRPCPRCGEPLSLCEYEGEALVGCTTCGGLWLSSAALQRIVEEEQRRAIADVLPTSKRSDALPPLPPHPVRYLPCPECGELMLRKSFAHASGIVIDRCALHGCWLDIHELEHIRRFVADGGIGRTRAEETEREQMELEAAAREARLAQALATTRTGPLRGTRYGRWGFVEALADLVQHALLDRF